MSLFKPKKPKNKFNTSLNQKESEAFDLHSKQFPSLINDKADYDTQGFYQEIYRDKNGDMGEVAKALTPGDPFEHIGTDRYKKPSHPTFSNESKYHIPFIRQGGHWKNENYFTASRRNMKNLANSEFGSAEGYFNFAEDLDGDGKPNIGLKLKYRRKPIIEPQEKR